MGGLRSALRARRSASARSTSLRGVPIPMAPLQAQGLRNFSSRKRVSTKTQTRTKAASRKTVPLSASAKATVKAALSMPAPVGSRSLSGLFAKTSSKQPEMFCFQCEQTRDGTGCRTIGVCGKTPEVAALQDLLVYTTKGIATYARKARELGVSNKDVDNFLLGALFVTVTNVNFDEAAVADWIQRASLQRDVARQMYSSAGGKETFSGAAAFDVAGKSIPELIEMGKKQGIYERQHTHDADYIGLQEMATYGLKGAAAYMYHATSLSQSSEQVATDMTYILDELNRDDMTVEELLALNMKVGEMNYKVMELLDKGHTDHFQHPVPTPVTVIPKEGKSILVSGHDLIDLEVILKQVEGTDINVYTHGEMLPAHSYPGLAKYKNLAGHWGGPWQIQKFDFHEFKGPIVMTSNCIVEPRKSYKNRIFTKNAVGWPGVTHIKGDDYSAVIQSAMETDGFDADDVEDINAQNKVKTLMTGFGHNAVMGVAPTVIEAVKGGAISHFFLVGGCDGSEGERSYYTDLVKHAPKDTVFLTLGCGKYRINKLDVGDIGGIPRVLDMGQCNDSYSAIQVALALAKAFDTDVNGLPLNLVLSWFEQKAVAVLLTLLHLGVKNIRIGPNLPAFATPNILGVLVKEFGVAPIDEAKKDLEIMLKK